MKPESPGVAILAWGLSAATLILPETLERSLGEGSRLALALLPWIALIGLPLWHSPEQGVGDRVRRGWPVALAAALPVLALAGWLDLRAGMGAARLAGVAAFGLPVLVLLGEARHVARPRGRGLYGGLWFVLVPGAAALAAARGWAVSGRLAEGGLEGWLARVSPLSTAWADFEGVPGSPALALLRPALGAAALLLAVVWSRASAGGAGE